MGSGTIVGGTAVFTMIGSPIFRGASGDATFITDQGSIDQLYKYTWYYRTPLTNQNAPMSQVDTPTEAYNGDTALISWTNAGPGPSGSERFDAQLMVHVIDSSTPGQGAVIHAMTVRNASESTRTFQFFNLIDLDVGGTPLDDTCEAGDILPTTGARIVFRDPSGKMAECFGQDASRWEVGPGSVLRARLSSGAQNLSNASEPFTGDGAAAFQWTVTLAPGEIRTFFGGFAVEQPVPCPADLDGNGYVNGEDVDAFLLYFSTGNPLADFDRNGFTNGDDFAPFMDRFLAGC